MTTNINITVDQNGLLAQVANQTRANHGALIIQQEQRKTEDAAVAKLTEKRRSLGQDIKTGKPLPSAPDEALGNTSANNRTQYDPAANRRGGLFVDIGYYRQDLRDTGALYLQFTKEIFAASGDGLQIINELLNETIPPTFYYPSVTTSSEIGDFGNGPELPKPGSGTSTGTTVWEDGASFEGTFSFSYGATFPDGSGGSCYSGFQSSIGIGRFKELSDDSAWYALPIRGGDGFILIYHRLQVEEWRNFRFGSIDTGTTCSDGSQFPATEEINEEEYEDPIYLADLHAFRITAKNCRKITVPSLLQEKVNTFPLFEQNNLETDPSAELVSPHAATYDEEGIVQDSFDVEWWGPNYYENSQTLSKPSAVKVKTKNGPFPVDVTNASLDGLELVVVSDWRVPAFCRASLLALGFTPADLSSAP